MKKLADFSGKVAIVTGGARGIGLSIARGLKECGAKVVVTDVSSREIKETEGLHFMQCDNRNEKDIVHMVEKVVEQFGRIDILVNNAGIVLNRPAVEIQVDDWEEVFRVNVTGTFVVSREAGKVMLGQGKGRIINIGSNYGSIGMSNYSAYCASKAAVIHMSRVLALEWAREGIRVNAVSPAATRTEMTRARLEDPEIRSRYESYFPVGRLLEPEDLVGAVIFLASDASDMVTGHNLNVDGGYLSQ